MTHRHPGPARSVLFAPANHARRVERALTSDADLVVLDLEDAVAPGEKAAARDAVRHVLRAATHPRLYVRVNGTASPHHEADLVCLANGHLEGVVLPKAESATELQQVDAHLTALEGLSIAPPLTLMPIVESATGVTNADAIAGASPRIRRLIFGGADYSLDLDLSLDWSESETELLYARSRLAHASRAARVEAPIDTATLQLRDHERYLRSARQSLALGFQGKLCLHPDHVALAHAVYTPTAEAIDEARAILGAYRAALAAGSASIEVNGLFVDEAIAERARRVLQRAGQRED